VTCAVGRRRVLIVDDEAALQSAYRRYFRDRYELAFAGTGAAALEQCAAQPPDVVVVDLHLPDTDAIELLRQMRSTRPALPAVITSAAPDLLPVLDALRITRTAYLMKPFSLDTLRACIDAAR
jgi:DNA-binding response OmpR family regulator